ncbi:hypothetical protein Droror1_Dr00003495 [Drosera rotundifolia]
MSTTPICNRNAFPIAASASLSSKFLASLTNTIEGNDSIVLSTAFSSSWSGLGRDNGQLFGHKKGAGIVRSDGRGGTN